MSHAPKLFISHAVKDKELVDSFFDLIEAGIGVSSKETFCSSLEGMGIPAGVNFVDHIKEKIQSPEVILLMLSPNYLDSVFCLCELGAGWAMSHNVIPIVIPPTKFSDLDAVLTGIQAYKIDDKSKLSELREQLVDLLAITPPAAARWEVKRDKFLKSLPKILKAIESPGKVARSEYDDLSTKYEEAKGEFEKYEAEIERLTETIERLETCKDREEVLAVKYDMSDEWTLFEDCCREAETALEQLPSIVGEVIFHDMNGNRFVPDQWNSDWENVREAASNDFLSISRDDEISLNHADPSVERALESLARVRKFLDGGLLEDGVSGDFKQQYRDKYDHNPVFNSRRLWEACLFP